MMEQRLQSGLAALNLLWRESLLWSGMGIC